MDTQLHPVVVVGAGSSGLTSIKSCLEEKLQVICFEKMSNLAGIWRYREEAVKGVAGVIKSTMINTSKEMTAFSDFPHRPDTPAYMHNSYMLDYLEAYVDKFQFRQFIRFQHDVRTVNKAGDYATTGHWIVTCVTKEGKRVEQRASAVILGSGLYGFPKWPTYEGQDTFGGRSLHVHSYKHSRGFEDQTVLVVGIGNSGGDVAVELSHICKKVYISSKRGTWVIQRLGINGNPIDTQFVQRSVEWILGKLPSSLKNSIAEYQVNKKFDHKLYNLKPYSRFYSQRPLVNDEIATRIVSGKLEVKGDVHRFTTDGVQFVDDNEHYPIDTVIFATGYKPLFPYLEPSAPDSDEPSEVNSADASKMVLYKFVFPIDQPHPTLAFIGNVVPFGSALPVIEMQSRFVARVLSKQIRLPPTQVMRDDYERNRDRIRRTAVPSQWSVPHVNYIGYLDELARIIGTAPDLSWRSLIADWRLWFACVFGPCIPFQYRLVGPHRWQGARTAILTSGERFKSSLGTRKCSDDRYGYSLLWCVLALVLLTCLLTTLFSKFV